jgi:methyl-accepting chemotaxis protein
MDLFTHQLQAISDQTHQLCQSSEQIVAAMSQVDGVTETIIGHTNALAHHAIHRLVQQSDALQQALYVFTVEKRNTK